MLSSGLLCLAVAGAAVGAPLPRLHIDRGNITVSGLSAGGFAAVQLHVAFSSTFRGAGVFARAACGELVVPEGGKATFGRVGRGGGLEG